MAEGVTSRLKCEVAREALRVFAENPRAATEFSEWCVQQKVKKELQNETTNKLSP